MGKTSLTSGLTRYADQTSRLKSCKSRLMVVIFEEKRCLIIARVEKKIAQCGWRICWPCGNKSDRSKRWLGWSEFDVCSLRMADIRNLEWQYSQETYKDFENWRTWLRISFKIWPIFDEKKLLRVSRSIFLARTLFECELGIIFP